MNRKGDLFLRTRSVMAFLSFPRRGNGQLPVLESSAGLHGLEERCDLAQSVGIVANQGMAAGWKEDGPAVRHAGGDVLRPTGRAESIVFGADGQDRAGDLLDRIRLVRGGGFDVEVHPCDPLV